MPANDKPPRKLSRPSRKTLVWTAGVIGGVALAFVLFLGLFDWNYFKGPVERMASARVGRTVKIEGDLSVKLLSWTPSADIHGLRIANPAWAGPGDMTAIDRLQFQVKLMPLFRGQVILPLVQADKPIVALFRQKDGRNNWTFGKSKKPLSLPPIRRFEINDGDLTLKDDVRKLEFAGKVTSREILGGQSIEAFKLSGDGRLNGSPFKMTLTGGPLLNVDPNRPYPFNANVSAGATRVLAVGTIAKPFNLGAYDTTLTVSGEDLAGLYFLTGLAFPTTPPYRLTGAFSRRDFLYRYNGLSGRIGDTDIRGNIAVQGGQARPFMSANLKSKRLDFDDLATILGAGAPAKRGETTSPEQAKIAQTMAANDRLFPDTPLRVERLRAMDAKVNYSADSVTSDHWPVRKASVALTLNDGVLKMDPLVFGFPQGQIAGVVAINAKRDTPAVDMDLRLTGARIEQFVPASFKPVVQGGMVGRAKLSGSGISVRAFASHANGQVSLIVPKGEMREGVAELLGVNVLKALFSDKQDKTPVRCAVADFKVRDGIMTAETIVIDTGPVIASGGGSIDLKTERMALRVKGHPKEVRLVRLNLPLELKGSLRHPAFGADASSAVGQAGVAVVVGAVLAPLAAILPFVSSGAADDADCRALIAGAGNGKAAPAKTVAAAKPKPKA